MVEIGCEYQFSNYVDTVMYYKTNLFYASSWTI